MLAEDQALARRFNELSERAAARRIYVYSDFLTLAEQAFLARLRFSAGAPFLWGGWESAERKLAVFGDPALIRGEPEPPALWLSIKPLSARFGEGLSHRDYFGALMKLGLRREALGDLVAGQDEARLCCMKTLAPLLERELVQVGRVAVRCENSQAPPSALAAAPKERELVVASERLDALVAAVFALSRTEAQALIAAERVAVDGRPTQSATRLCRAGELISVRGHGRFAYEGVLRETKKERLRVAVRSWE